jgi:AmmeMemoRadiSam system protein B
MSFSSATEEKIRKSIVDGLFYPQNQEGLKTEIESLLENVNVSPQNASAVITPHAAFRYVGKLMAMAFKASSKRHITTAVILAPVHRDASHELYLPESVGFSTPLGTVKINTEVVERLLAEELGMRQNEVPFEEEHSVEVQLPFIQSLFPTADFVPILIGTLDRGEVGRLSAVLRSIFKEQWESVLFVASTNMGSYRRGEHRDRFHRDEKARVFSRLIQQRNLLGIIEAVHSREINACGAYCVAVLLSLFDKNYGVKLLKETSSEGIDPKSEDVVYYSAISIYQDAIG